MTRHEFRFFEPLRVRWAEIDAQKIVFNGHYLMYLDTAVAGYWRALALPYAASMAHLEGDLYVRKATLDYLGSAHYDDQLDVGLRCERIGTSSIVFVAGVFRGAQLLVGGELVYVFADPATQTSRAVPDSLRAILAGFEAGEAMVEVRVGPWAELGAEAQAIRMRVFVDEQKVPLALERDDADDRALHALARNRLGMALATGRLLPHAAGAGRIGRMAVLPGLRGSGVGRQVLEALTAAARARGDREIKLHAQVSAAGFYRRAGYETCGDVFDEAGIAHVEMARTL